MIPSSIELIEVFSKLPRMGARAIVLRAEGDHFCAGLDLIEHHNEQRRPEEFMNICLRWHEAFNKMEYGGVPIIAALKGAVVGGGLELASSAHVRVADQTTYFALPEGQRGLFTGGGATIRVADLVGKARMIDMMLTGRVYKQQEAVDVGLCQYIYTGGDTDDDSVGANVVPNLVGKVGHIRVFAAFASTASLSILLHSVIVDPYVWIFGRFITGFSIISISVSYTHLTLPTKRIV